jgi:hypothetical protein
VGSKGQAGPFDFFLALHSALIGLGFPSGDSQLNLLHSLSPRVAMLYSSAYLPSHPTHHQ